MSTFTELKAAVAARGFDDLTDAQLGQLVNDACVELDSMREWPYREKTATGAAPLTITDLGPVEAVTDTTNDNLLSRIAPGEVLERFGELTTAGMAVWWYTTTTGVAVFPVSTTQLSVRYWRTTPVLSAGSDTPLAPSAWHSLVVDIAAGAAYTDGETPPGLQARIDRRVGEMTSALMADYGPTTVAAYGDDC